MRLAVSSRSFEPLLDTGRLRLWDVPGEVRVLGLTRVELHDAYLQPLGLRMFGALRRFFSPPSPAPPDRAYDFKLLRRIEKSLEYYDMSLAAWGCDSELGDPALLARARAYIRLALDAARQLGAPVLRITLDDAALRGNVEPVIDTLGVLTVDAEVAGVRLAIENQRAAGSVERMLGIVQGVNSPWLGVCLNFENFDPRNPAELFERLAREAVHVHAVSRGSGEPDGVVRAYIGVLHTLRYDGVVSVEYLGDEDPASGVRRTIATLERWC